MKFHFFQNVDQKNNEIKLYLKIALIMLILTFASIIIYLFFGEANFTSNLFSEFLSIIITAVIINWLFERHKTKQWEGTEFRISKRIKKLIIIYGKSLRLGYNIKMDYNNDNSAISGKINYEEILKTLNTVKTNPQSQTINWDKLMDIMKDFEKKLNNIMITFEPKLKPQQHELLSDIEDSLEKLNIGYYKSYSDPDIYNVIVESEMKKNLIDILDKLLELDKIRKIPPSTR